MSGSEKIKKQAEFNKRSKFEIEDEFLNNVGGDWEII